MLHFLPIALFLPLFGFLILLFSSETIGRRLAGWIGCTSIFLSFLAFTFLLFFYVTEQLSPQTLLLFSWIPVEKINANFSLHLDPLSLIMSLIITGVGFLIHVYSIGYMEHDEDIARYFACMNFFVFSMLLLVLAEHLLVLFVGWEGVGLASYLLIGFWYQRPAAAQAATKAFVVNRIGDLGLLIGLLLTFYIFETGNITEINERVTQEFSVDETLLLVLTVLYFIGATGKSAQLPLYTWLPDAMEGPTPVSALIHAATMVTAGVYLVVRMHPVFMLAPTVLHSIGVVGAVTSLFAALCATAQTDLKRVLAYSTISQLGLMFLACGIGAFYAAMFHLTTHAFMKSLLFLSAGNVVHMMRGTTDMKKMGGLAREFPKTHWLFLIGALSMSGIPPLAAFFSKDLILEQEYLAGFETLFYVGLTVSILTAFYLIRAYCLTFTGPHRLEEKILKSVHEASSIMIAPLIVLALLSIGGGFLGFSVGKTSMLQSFLAEVDITLAEEEPAGGLLSSPETWMSIGGALAGVLFAVFLYTQFPGKLGRSFDFLKKSFYINEIYRIIIVSPLRRLSRFISEFLEPKVFDGSLDAVVLGVDKISTFLQRMQNGQMRSYVAWMAIGTIFLIAFFAFDTFRQVFF